MTWQEIFNIIIAAVPSLTAIVTVLVLAIKVIASLVNLKNSVKEGSATVDKQVEELKANNTALQGQVAQTNQMVIDVIHSVETLIANAEKNQNDNAATQEELNGVKEELETVKAQTEKLDNEMNVVAKGV